MDFATFDAMAPEEKRVETLINQVALATNVPPCALAAIARRESNFVPNAKSDDGGFGLCQVTAGAQSDGTYQHEGRTYNLLNARDNLVVAAQFFLRPAIDDCSELRKKHADIMDAINTEILYFAFAAYNAGFGTVQEAVSAHLDPDVRTTNRYASGTLANYHRYLAMASTHADG